MDGPPSSGWHKTHTWFFSGIGTLLVSLVLAAIIARKSPDIARDPSPTPPPAISPLSQSQSPSVAEYKSEIDNAKRRAAEEKEAQFRAEIQRLDEQREERMRAEEERIRAEADRLATRRADQARAEEERLERQREEMRRQEERARQEAANTWQLARVRNRARVAISYSVLSDGEWKPYTVAPGATAGHARHGNVIIEFDRGGGRGTNRLTLNSSTVHAARPSKADQDSAPASYFGTRPDGSLIISPR
jgi:hypothetical protein